MNPAARNATGPLSQQLRLRTSFDQAAAWLSVVFPFFAALLLYLHALGSPSLWFDEAFSVELARQPLPRLWQAIWGPEPNMELYYLLLHFWLQLTGALGPAPTEFILRLPSAFCAALLYLLNYSILIYAQQTRAYARQHPRLFSIVERVPDSQAAQQVSAVETWPDQHYQLLASMSSAGGISVHLYAVVPSSALLRTDQGADWS